MKEFDKRIFWNQIFLSKEYRPGEAALMDVATDSGNVLMKEFSHLAGCMKVEVEGHLKRTPSLFSGMHMTFFNDASNLIGGDINPASDSDNVLDDLFLSPVIKSHKAYPEKPCELFGREEEIGFGIHLIPSCFSSQSLFSASLSQ